MRKLYRGVCKQYDFECGSKLRPKGTKAKVTMKLGDNGLKVDGTWKVGQSEENTVRAHQLESGRHNGCLISTTRNEQIAIHFATSGNIEEGFVYVIDEDKLEEYGVVAFERKYFENGHEKEVSLMASDNGDLPDEIICDKYEVKPNT